MLNSEQDDSKNICVIKQLSIVQCHSFMYVCIWSVLLRKDLLAKACVELLCDVHTLQLCSSPLTMYQIKKKSGMNKQKLAFSPLQTYAWLETAQEIAKLFPALLALLKLEQELPGQPERACAVVAAGTQQAKSLSSGLGAGPRKQPERVPPFGLL